MPKAAAIGRAAVPGVKTPFSANVAPDAFDARDLLYRPRLQPLPDALDRRVNAHVYTQQGSSCTGHAVAAMINTVLANKEAPCLDHVSPYMLYHLARRYDEFPGEEDAGSSLRGVLKGWWRHGVALQDEWPKLKTHIDLENEKLIASCGARPLGAFYRVDTQRLDDMQSAITELHAIVASARIHDGWQQPVDDGNGNFIITRKPGSFPIGGHAFALVGYNHIGFLVQNSWGTKWGKGGFATLPYEDWLVNAYDAWVARPGVPHTPFAKLDRTISAQGENIVSASLDSAIVRRHVLNLANDGRLSKSGRATSSPAQLRELIASMKQKHAEWGSNDVVIYIHGGLVSEPSGLEQVAQQFQWWLNNHVYPIFVVWQSGAMETLLNKLDDMVGAPARTNFAVEAMDRAIERICASVLAFGWNEMKQNGAAASKPLASLPSSDEAWFGKPGISLLLRLLQQNAPLRLHVVVHSAGAVLADDMLPRLEEYGLPVESLNFLAAACTVSDFDSLVVPRLGNQIKRFAGFALNDDAELDDTCARVYHKSLLYLVSRGFEQPKNRETPLVGMEHFFPTKLKNGKTLGEAAPMIVAREAFPPETHGDSRSHATDHSAFHSDVATMTAVLLRIKNQRDVTTPEQRYQPNAQPLSAVVAPAGSARMRIKDRRRNRRGTEPRGGSHQRNRGERDRSRSSE